MKKWIALAVVAAVIVAIWHNSWQSADVSDGLSLLITRKVQWIFNDLGFHWSVAYTNHVLRKMAHAFEFMCLGITAYIAFTVIGWCRYGRWIGTLLLCIVVAATDEYFQFFSPGRAPMWQDVVLDSAGGLAGIILASVVGSVFRYMTGRRR